MPKVYYLAKQHFEALHSSLQHVTNANGNYYMASESELTYDHTGGYAKIVIGDVEFRFYCVWFQPTTITGGPWGE